MNINQIKTKHAYKGKDKVTRYVYSISNNNKNKNREVEVHYIICDLDTNKHPLKPKTKSIPTSNVSFTSDINEFADYMLEEAIFINKECKNGN